MKKRQGYRDVAAGSEETSEFDLRNAVLNSKAPAFGYPLMDYHTNETKHERAGLKDVNNLVEFTR